MDPLDDSREAKRYRSRKRKEFLKAVSDQSRNESDADGDSEFSFGSSFTSSFNRGVSMDSSSLASMSSFDLRYDVCYAMQTVCEMRNFFETLVPTVRMAATPMKMKGKLECCPTALYTSKTRPP